MTSSKTVKTDKSDDYQTFDQSEYNNDFKCCEEGHAFIAFVTCYCPLCEALENLVASEKENFELLSEAEAKDEKLDDLVQKALRTNPEILI